MTAAPLAFVETGFFLLAAPLILLMGVWAAVTAYRIIVPEAPLPPDRSAHRHGVAAPVRARQIVAEQRRRPTPVLPASPEAAPDAESIAESLWVRRN